MALFPDRHPLLRQPSHAARINERHWLARDLVFVHSGLTPFVFGRPIELVHEPISAIVPEGIDHPGLAHTRGWVPNGSDYQEYLLGYSGITTPLTLSVWWVGFASNVTDYCLTVRRASGSAGGFELRRSSAEAVTINSMDASGGSNSSNGSGAFVANSWQHAVGVVASATSRTGYRNGDGGSTGTASRTAPSDLDRVAIGCSAAATPVVTASPAVTGIALPMVIGRVLHASEVERLHEEQRSNPWVLFSAPPIWVPVSAGSGTQTLTPDLFTNSNTFYTHTVTTESVTLTPDLFNNSNSFYTHTINSVYTLLPDLFTNTNTFYTHTVTTGAVTLTPSLFTNTNSFYTPTVSSSYIVTPDLFTNTNTFYTPVVTNLSTLYPDLFTNSQTFYTHVVTGGGGQTLEPSLFSNSATFYGPTITVGSVTLTASLFTNTNDIYSHTVTSNYPLTPDLFSNSSSFYTPTISVGAVTLTPSLFTNSSTFYTHTISNSSTTIYFWKRTA